MNLLKCVLAIVITAHVGAIVKAQVPLSLKGGVSFSNVDIGYYHTEPYEPYSPTSGFFETVSMGGLGGVSMTFRIFDSLYFEPEIDFLQMGYKSAYNDDELTRLNYISLPLNLRYRANKNLDIFFGPYASYLAGGEDSFRKGDFGLDLGLEVRIYKNMGIGVRYFFGLMDIRSLIEETGGYFYQVHDTHNRSLQSYVFYRFKN